jgi:hypothetical protein
MSNNSIIESRLALPNCGVIAWPLPLGSEEPTLVDEEASKLREKTLRTGQGCNESKIFHQLYCADLQSLQNQILSHCCFYATLRSRPSHSQTRFSRMWRLISTLSFACTQGPHCSRPQIRQGIPSLHQLKLEAVVGWVPF